jgi:hypothetical protein
MLLLLVVVAVEPVAVGITTIIPEVEVAVPEESVLVLLL